jgi:EpsI family protein
LIGEWIGNEDGLPSDLLKTLKLNDYLNAIYSTPGQSAPIGLYIAYYASQRKGASTHSPASCIPAGGWDIERIESISLPEVGRSALKVNRVIISKGRVRQLVYYWFQQRGRSVTNEYKVKWYILLDAIARGRTDGAMVRLVMPIDQNGDLSQADRTLQDFIKQLEPHLKAYIPD